MHKRKGGKKTKGNIQRASIDVKKLKQLTEDALAKVIGGATLGEYSPDLTVRRKTNPYDGNGYYN
jgi:bacteriocin-like protein